MKTKKLQRAPDSTTVTISLKKSLRDRIDAAAEAEQRSRSNYIVKALHDAIVAYERHIPVSGGEGKKAKPAEG